MLIVKQFNGEILLLNKELEVLNSIKSLNAGKFFHSPPLILSNKNHLIDCGQNGIAILDISKIPVSPTIYQNQELGEIYTTCELPANLIAAGGSNKTIYILNSQAEIECSHKYPGGESTRSILCLLWVEETDTIWAGDWDGHIYLITAYNSLPQIHILPQDLHKNGDYVSVLEEKKATRMIFSAGKYGKLGAWGYDGHLLFVLPIVGKNPISSIYIYGDQNIILGDSKGYLQVWTATLHTQLQLARFAPHKAWIRGKSICPFGESEFVVTASEDKSVKIMDPIKMEIIKEMLH